MVFRATPGEPGVVFAPEPGAAGQAGGEGAHRWKDLHVTRPASGLEYDPSRVCESPTMEPFPASPFRPRKQRQCSVVLCHYWIICGFEKAQYLIIMFSWI